MSAVEHFILEQEPEHKNVLMQLHDMLLSFEGVTAKIKWRIPVYYSNKYFCYLNPIKKSNRIELCFVQGFSLKDPSGILKDRGRKQIKGVYIEQLDSEEFIADINQLFIEAIELNKTLM